MWHARSTASRFVSSPLGPAVEAILERMHDEAPGLYAQGARRKSDFFRDLAGSRYHALAEHEARERRLAFEAPI